MRKLFLIFMVVGLISINLAYAQPFNPPLSGEMTRLEVFQKPIPMTEVILSSRDKGLTYLSDYKGKVLLLNVWATWCPPCVVEMPSLNSLQRDLNKEKFAVIAVSLEKDVDVVKKFMTDKKLDALHPYIDANGDVQKLEALRDAAGVPVSLIIDSNMQVVARYQGDADWNSPEAKAVINYFLSQQSKTSSRPYGVDVLKSISRGGY